VKTKTKHTHTQCTTCIVVFYLMNRHRLRQFIDGKTKDCHLKIYIYPFDWILVRRYPTNCCLTIERELVVRIREESLSRQRFPFEEHFYANREHTEKRNNNNNNEFISSISIIRFLLDDVEAYRVLTTCPLADLRERITMLQNNVFRFLIELQKQKIKINSF